MPRRGKSLKQQTMESVLGQPKMVPKVKAPRSAKTPQPKQTTLPLTSGRAATSKAGGDYRSPPSSTFLPRLLSSGRRVIPDSSSSSAQEDTVIPADDDGDELPRLARRFTIRNRDGDDVQSIASITSDSQSQSSSQGISHRPVLPDDDDDEDDFPVIPPLSSTKRRREQRKLSSDEDDRNARFVSPTKRRRLVRKIPDNPERSTSGHGSKEDDPFTSELSTAKKGHKKDTRTLHAPVKRRARKQVRTAKQKQMELLRRRRAGENISEDDLETSSDEEDHKALYDSDPDHPALEKFEDDDEGFPEEENQGPPTSKKTTQSKKDDETAQNPRGKRSQTKDDEPDSDDEDNLENFIVEDDEDTPLGVPHHLIPLEFTSFAHKSPKEHFRDAIEWLIQKRLNRGGFDQDDPVYVNALRKLSDEVTGLANSKFASSAWKTGFQRALRARPFLESFEIPKGDPGRSETCQACGRSGHPATWKLLFIGSPYYEKTLEDVEQDSDDDDDDKDECSVDEHDNELPPKDKEWYVGAVCQSNAATAHSLIHWKYALKEWVEERLDKDGLLSARQVVQRDRMTPKKKYKLVEDVLRRWEADGQIRALHGEFKQLMEQARRQTTTGKSKSKGWR